VVDCPQSTRSGRSQCIVRKTLSDPKCGLRTKTGDMYPLVTKLLVRNLSPNMTVQRLDRLFSEFGTVRSVSLATDVMTGRCGGFGHVHLHERDAGAALCALNGKSLGGRILRVTVEQRRFPSPGQH